MADGQSAMVKSNFEGKWKLDRSEKFDDFLKEMGVGTVKRKMVCNLTPSCEIKIDGEKIIISTTTSINVKTEMFKLGEEFESVVVEKKGKVIATFEDGKLVVTPLPSNDIKFPKFIRYIEGGEMCMEKHIGDVVCRRYFKRI